MDDKRQSVAYAGATPGLQTQLRARSGSNACDFIRFDDDHCNLIALVDGAPVGLIVAKKRALSPPLQELLEVYIDVIEVLPAYQRQGIATELMARVIAWAIESGAYQIRAWSDEVRIEALQLWRKLDLTFSRVDYQQGDEKRYGFYVTKRL